MIAWQKDLKEMTRIKLYYHQKAITQNQINAGNVTRIINSIRYMLNRIGYASDEEEDSN